MRHWWKTDAEGGDGEDRPGTGGPSPLIARLREAGTEQELTGKTPFFLDGKERVWCLLEGQADVFFSSRSGNIQTGAREYLFTARRGDLLFGVEPPPRHEGEGLVVVGIPGTRVMTCSREAFLVAASEGHRTEAAAGVDRFLEGLGRGVVKDIVPRPRIQKFGDAPARDLPRDVCVAPDDFVAWVHLDAGSALFTGTEDFPVHLPFCPLPSCCWLLPGDQAHITVRRTEDLLAGTDFVASFDGWGPLAFALLSMNALLRAGDELGNLRSRQREDREALSRACTGLASALDGEIPGYGGDGSPLGSTCAKVLETLGMEVPLPRSCGDKDLFDVAFESDLRLREVRLDGGWWTRDGEPLVAFLEERSGRKKPVALLPGGRTYRLWDEGREELLSEELARRLGDTAWQIHAHLAEEPLDLRSFFSFGLRGLGREGWKALFLELSMALLALASPAVNGLVFGEILPRAEMGRMVQLTAVLISVALSSGLLRFAREISHSRLESRMNLRLVLGLWDRILRLPAKFFSAFPAGDLVNRGIGLLSIRRAISPAWRMARIQGLFFLFFLGQCFWFVPESALAGTVCLLLLGGLAAVITRSTLALVRRMVPLQNRALAFTFQVLHGIAKIRGSGAENRVFERWAHLERRKRRLVTEARTRTGFLESAMVVFPCLSTGAVFLSLDMHAGAVEIGSFMAFLSAWGGLQVAFVALLSSLVTLATSLPLAENLLPILEARPESGTGKADPGRITGKIDLENVTFRYHPDGRPILCDLQLHVRPGEFLAVVGSSGSGKSTLLRLLLGFEVPEAGSIFYDSKDLNDMDLKKLRSQIGVVLQGGGLLSGDIVSNVRCSRRMTLEQVEEALAVAGMKDEVEAMPMGVHTVVGGEGSSLSGGQKQRLLIARAVAGSPRVLLFDEATSALDNRTQGQITRSLERIDATRIVVAHRLSTVLGADRIVVLDGGRIGEEGTYGELMARQGLFYRLARRQLLERRG